MKSGVLITNTMDFVGASPSKDNAGTQVYIPLKQVGGVI
jgi:hypothetical protein